MRQLKSLVLVIVLAGTVLAEQLPDGVGVTTASGSVFTSEITAGDCDDYVFQGYPGMIVSASAKILKGSTLKPQIQLIRPGGSIVLDDEGLALSVSTKSAAARFALDATGWWQVRVRGAEASVGTYQVSVKYTTPKLPTLPAVSKGFKSAGAISPLGDVDEYTFQGYVGQSLSATLAIAKGSALDPQLHLVRPDGTAATSVGIGTKETKLLIARSLDAAGIWRLRIVGEEADPAPPHSDLTTGPYSLTVKLGKPILTGLTPDSNGQYRLTFPAIGGAAVGYSLSFSGSAPTFNSFTDPTGRPVTGFPGGVSVKSFPLPPRLSIGDFVLTFDAPAGAPPANVQFTRTLVLPKGSGKRNAKFASLEPVIRTNGINPVEGGPGTLMSVQANNLIDPNSPNGSVGLLLGHVSLEDVQLQADGITVRGTVPDDLPEGVFDVVVSSSSGQVAAKADAFRRVPPPAVSGIDPTVGTEGGGFTVTITGSNFRPGRMGILLDGFLQPVTPDATLGTDTSVTFNAPRHTPGFVVFGVKDLDTQLNANLPLNSFEYVATPAVSRIVPSLVPVLGNEIVAVQGANFSLADKVYIETTPNSGTYELMTTPSTPTFINSRQHQFLAPVRAKGVYRVYVQDSQGQPNPPKSRNLTYYSFADATASTNLGSLGADKYDGWTTALSDFDKDGDQDIFVSRRGDPADLAAGAASLTRVLRNNGGSQFTDVTSSVMPAPSADDWRADRIWSTDMNADTFPDIAITTNTLKVPIAGVSHTRLLINEVRGGGGVTSNDRVFRDRTLDLMAPPRTMQKYGLFGGPNDVYVSDDWRGLDMWIGDIDKGAAGPPEIVLTHDEVKDDDNYATNVFDSGVYCGNYCSTSQSGFAYAYTFYWGGSRLFVWDKTARSGQGRYKFDPAFFPRSGGPLVPTAIPGGGTLNCSTHYNSKCKDTFTPFRGKRATVGSLDGDTKPDVAVLSDQNVERRAKINDPMLQTSSLQVGINKFNPKDGASITDMTGVIWDLGGETRGDAVAIGQPGYPDGNPYGVIAFARAAAQGGSSVMRLLKYLPGAGNGSFEDITSLALPAVDVNDFYQASQVVFIDVDQDGDQDLVLLANAPPGGTETALRILRNERVGNTVGNLRKTLIPLLAAQVTANEHFEGAALSIGDVTGDAIIDYVVTRATPSPPGTQLRIVKTDK